MAGQCRYVSACQPGLGRWHADVGVEQRVAVVLTGDGAGVPMPEARGDEPVTGHPLTHPGLPPPAVGAHLLEVAQRLPGGVLMRLPHRVDRRLVTEGEQQADRLRRPEAAVHPGHPPSTSSPASFRRSCGPTR